MKTKSLMTLFLLCHSLFFFSQENKLDKKMETAYTLFEKGKYREADSYVEKIVNENPSYGTGWDYLSKIRLKISKDLKTLQEIYEENVTSSAKNKKQEGTSSKSSSETLSQNDISKIAYSKYIYTLRQGLLKSEDAFNSSKTLRNLFVDLKVDTLINKQAAKYYESGEAEFIKKKYEAAAKFYKRAVEEQPNFYKARLNIGDCYYFMKNYPNSTTAFKEASIKFPNHLEPRIYLIDSYLKENLFDKAIEECINAMTVYPDLTIQKNMSETLNTMGKKLLISKTSRVVFPNKMDNLSKELYIPKNEITLNDPWIYYKEASAKIKDYCDHNGMVTAKNSLTQSNYLELYSWEYMLQNSTHPDLQQAIKMQKDGFLDCYIFITCFHFDFYQQYLHFVTHNKDKVSDYYLKYIINK